VKPSARIILITGVAGTGKTTIGAALAHELGWPYFEGDDFHSAANKDKMRHGIPLTDQDREPWLNSIRVRIEECVIAGRSAVFTCSALKEKYRQTLMSGQPAVLLVYLSADLPTLLTRLLQRTGHYMKADMLQSQLHALEVPANAVTIDCQQSPLKIIAEIRQRCAL
jgi:gluconokinase